MPAKRSSSAPGDADKLIAHHGERDSLRLIGFTCDYVLMPQSDAAGRSVELIRDSDRIGGRPGSEPYDVAVILVCQRQRLGDHV